MARHTHKLVQAVDKAEKVLRLMGPFIRKLVDEKHQAELGPDPFRLVRAKLYSVAFPTELISLEWNSDEVKMTFMTGMHTFTLTVTDIMFALSMARI